MTSLEAEQLARRFIAFIETGEPAPGLFCEDAFCDFTSPRWRVQAQGLPALLALRRGGHPGPGKVPRWRCDPTPNGFVLELEEEWQDAQDHWYCRELFRADVRGEAIAQLSVYCTGDWDSARRAQHAREVRLLRP